MEGEGGSAKAVERDEGVRCGQINGRVGRTPAVWIGVFGGCGRRHPGRKGRMGGKVINAEKGQARPRSRNYWAHAEERKPGRAVNYLVDLRTQSGCKEH